MEFQKREVKKKVPAGNDIEQKLLNWPDSFYRERDPLVRKSLLDAADQNNMTPEDNEFRRKLLKIRYPKIDNPSLDQTDLYLRAWMDLRFLATDGEGLFGRGLNPKKVMKVLSGMGYDLPADKREERLLYEELYHLGMLYIALCREDKTYNSLLLGLGTISETRQVNKIAAEFRNVGSNVMKKYHCTEEAALFSKAVHNAFADMFPDYAELLTIEDN